MRTEMFGVYHEMEGRHWRFLGRARIVTTLADRPIGWTIILTGLVIVAIAGLILLKLMTDVTAVGWTSLVIANAAVLSVQMLVSTIILLFLMLSQRLQIPMVPIRDFAKFIVRVDLIGLGRPAKTGEPDAAFVAEGLG